MAATLHGVPRTTWDLDLLIEATPQNASRLLSALVEAGLGTASLTTPEKLLMHEITIFRDFVRIDVQTQTPGIDFETSWKRRQVMTFDDQEFFVLTLEDTIASKRAAGRR